MNDIQIKNNEINTDKNWDDSIEKIAEGIGYTCIAYKIMHTMAGRNYLKIYTILIYVTIVVSPIAGIIAGIETAYFSGNGINMATALTFGIIISILTYTAGILSAVIKFAKFTEKSDAHRTASANYTAIENSVRQQLILSRKNREEARGYLYYITEEHKNLYNASPYIPHGIYVTYTKEAKEKGWVVPEEYSQIIDLEQDHVSNLTNTNEIRINLNENASLPETPIKAQRRNSVYTPIPEFNKLNDAKMKYEMNRFMGF